MNELLLGFWYQGRRAVVRSLYSKVINLKGALWSEFWKKEKRNTSVILQ